jgi:transcriptional regulator with XRE-family HTH domain
VSPASVGLPAGSRRRTPGLRREELAQLAGVGVTWYTWLEQGRSINVSGQVLGAVARALRLDANERVHLFTLAGAIDPAAAIEPETLPRAVLAMLDALEPHPAYVVNTRWDLLAYNSASCRLLGDLGAVPASQRNVMRLAFTQPSWSRMIVDWPYEAAWHVAMFRAAMAGHTGEPAWQALADELCAQSPIFAELWARHDVARPATRVKRFDHPVAGRLSLETTSLRPTERPQARMVVYLPADEASAAGLRRMAQTGS